MPNKTFAAVLFLAAVVFGGALAQPSRARESNGGQAAAAGACDRACLYGFLDQYLDALKAKDPSRLPLAKGFKYTENNVAMNIGDGVWGTVTGLGSYNL